jgi:protein ImuA
VLLQPPHPPQALALAALGVPPSQLIWLRSSRTADALWAAEQVLRSGSCGALLFWQNHARSESLRRLHLAAQSGETLFFMMRPLAAAQDASPAPLRLALRPARPAASRSTSSSAGAAARCAAVPAAFLQLL